MYISYEDTERAAEAFLAKYHPDRSIPIPIEKIVEIKLGISVVPRMNLVSNEGIDAFLSHDFTELYIDYQHYFGQTNRSRFTLAHEIGHYVLHREVVSQIKTMDDWKKFILGQGVGRAVYEIHADNFAGCLLMPRPEVSEEYQLLKESAQKSLKAAGMSIGDEKTLISFIANQVAKKFDASPKAAEIRLTKIFLKT